MYYQDTLNLIWYLGKKDVDGSIKSRACVPPFSRNRSTIVFYNVSAATSKPNFSRRVIRVVGIHHQHFIHRYFTTQGTPMSFLAASHRF